MACLGAVIRGETDHYDFVCAETARGVMQVQLRDRRAVRVRRADVRDDGAGARAFRAAGKRDQGRHAAEAVLRMAALRAELLGGGRDVRAEPSSARLPSAMAKVCHSCGKGPAFGQSRSHSMVATKRRFDPNLQKVRILVGKAPAARLCLHALSESRQGHQGRLSGSLPGERVRLHPT